MRLTALRTALCKMQEPLKQLETRLCKHVWRSATRERYNTGMLCVRVEDRGGEGGGGADACHTVRNKA